MSNNFVWGDNRPMVSIAEALKDAKARLAEKKAAKTAKFEKAMAVKAAEIQADWQARIAEVDKTKARRVFANRLNFKFDLQLFAGIKIPDSNYVLEDGIRYACDEQETRVIRKKKGTKKLYNDAFQKIALYGVSSAKELAAKLARHQQVTTTAELPGMDELRQAKWADAMASLKWTCENIYKTTNSLDVADKKRICTNKDKNIVVESLKVQKALTRVMYDETTNMCRVVSEEMALEQRAAAMLSIAVNAAHERKAKASAEGKSDDGMEVSSAPHVLTPEELLAYDLEYFSKIKETKDYLVECSFEDGDEAEFVAGFAESEDEDKSAIAEDDLNGIFTIRIDSETGKAYAVKDIRSFIQVPTPNRKHLIIKTKMNSASSAAIDALMALLVEGKEAYLVNMVKQNGKKVASDAIIIDNKIVAEIAFPAGGTCKAIQDLYSYKKGKVATAMIGMANDGNRGTSERVALIVLEDVEEIPKDTFDKVELEDLLHKKREPGSRPRPRVGIGTNAAPSVNADGKRVRPRVNIGIVAAQATAATESAQPVKRVRPRTGIVDNVAAGKPEAVAPTKKVRPRTGIVDAAPVANSNAVSKDDIVIPEFEVVEDAVVVDVVPAPVKRPRPRTGIVDSAVATETTAAKPKRVRPRTGIVD